MLLIPISDLYAQTLSVTLAGQNCRIELAQKSTGLVLDLYVNGALVIGGVLCRNRVRVVRSTYLKFAGDLVFIDQQAQSDPTSPGLGSRFLLYYVEAADLLV
jgi:hypothetical protein